MELVHLGMHVLFSLHASHHDYHVLTGIWLVQGLMQHMLK